MKKCISLLTTLVLILVGCGSMASCATKGTGTFTQGFWRGQDPRASYDPKTGYYYYVEDASAGMVMFRSKSLIERGDAENRRVMPTGFPLCAPVYVEKMNGVTYNKWFAFGSSAWQCDGDPFTGKWQNIGSFGLKGWTLDHFAFRVESGAHAGEWYLIWAAGEDLNNTTGFSAEHLHISKMLAPNKVQSNKSDASDLLLRCQKGSGWSGWDGVPQAVSSMTSVSSHTGSDLFHTFISVSPFSYRNSTYFRRSRSFRLALCQVRSHISSFRRSTCRRCNSSMGLPLNRASCHSLAAVRYSSRRSSSM